MPVHGGQPDYSSAPADYESFYAMYRPFVIHLCRKLGIEPQNAEDVAQDILIRLYERDILGMYDPETRVEHRGQTYKPRFQSFLSAHVQAYVKGKRQRQNQQAAREPIICDQPFRDTGLSWVEVFGPAYSDDLSRVEEHEMVIRVRTLLVSVPRRSKTDKCDLLALFDACVQHSRTYGKIDIKALQREFGVSNTAIHTWLRLLRETIRPVIDRMRQAQLV